MKITISKSQWQEMGRKAGWVKPSCSPQKYLSAAKLIQKEAGAKDIALAVMLFLSGWATKDIVNLTKVDPSQFEAAKQNQEVVADAKQLQQKTEALVGTMQSEQPSSPNTMQTGGMSYSKGGVGTGITGPVGQEKMYDYKPQQ